MSSKLAGRRGVGARVAGAQRTCLPAPASCRPEPAPAPAPTAQAGSAARRGGVGPPPRPLARDLRLFRQLIPRRLPLRHGEAGGARQGHHLGGERTADRVAGPPLEAILPIDASL